MSAIVYSLPGPRGYAGDKEGMILKSAAALASLT